MEDAGFLYVILRLYHYDFDLIHFERDCTHWDGQGFAEVKQGLSASTPQTRRAKIQNGWKCDY